MKIHRIQVKTFVRNPSGIKLQALIPVFHDWIQNDRLEDMLIDVADYEHVVDGPGILLIAHEADYALDRSRGRPGLLYTRKRDIPRTLSKAVAASLHRLYTAVRLLEEDTTLGGAYGFRSDELEIRFLDRLQVPNNADSLEAVREEVEAGLGAVYGDCTFDMSWIADDNRLPFALHVLIDGAPSTSELAKRAAITHAKL